VPGSSTKSILAAISAGVIGVNVSVEKNLYNDLATETILCEARSLRSRQMAKIINQTKKDISVYPLKAAELDIIEYYYCRTIQRALQSLHDTASASLKDARDSAAIARGIEKPK
jgi:hypothetical protein